MDKWPAAARLHSVAAASHLPTATDSGFNSYTTPGGTTGIDLRNNAEAHTGRIEAINRGSITTSGNLFSEGMRVESRATSAQAEVRAVNKGTVATTGTGSRAVYVILRGAGAAAATNEGSITTSGEVGIWEDTNNNVSHAISSDGIRVQNNGAGNARAINEAGGTIETSGSGAAGMNVRAASGDVSATNNGSITTRGDAYAFVDGNYALRADGMSARSPSGDATVTNLAGGSIETHGSAAWGISADSDNGDATIQNSGTVTTHGGPASMLPGWSSEVGARGLRAYSDFGDASIVNESSGSVETKGARAFGIFAGIGRYGSSSGGTAVVRNRGGVTTTGDNADAVHAFANGGGTSADPNRVEAYNEAGATIATSTDGSGALGATILLNAGAPNGGVDAFGSTYARNDGTITTAGAPGNQLSSAGDNAYGVVAAFWSGDDTEINNAGNVEAVNTGTITVSGAEARGVAAITFGTGRATVTVDGGSITASHDSATDSEDGVGIYASSGAAGGIAATVSNGATITAPQAVLFEGAPAVLTLTDSVMRGRVSFGDENDRFVIRDSVLRGDISMGGGDDTLRVEYATNMVGDIDFGAGTDTLELDVTKASRLVGNLTNLEYMDKMCPGDFTIDGDVMFTGSRVRVMEGGLIITGHMDLGSTGTVEVRDGTRLTGLLTQGGTPKITAGGGTTVETGGAITMQKAADAGTVDVAQAVTTFLEDANVQGGAPVTVQTRDGDGSLTELASFDPSAGTSMAMASVGTRSAETFPDENTVGGTPGTGTPGTGTPATGAGTGGGGGGAGGVAVGAGLLALMFALFDFGPDDDAQASILSPRPSFVQTMDPETRYWVRDYSQALPSGDLDRAEGVEIGMEFGVGNGFSVGFAGSPELSAERIGGQYGTALAGGRYSVSGGWRGEDGLFAKLSLSHADMQVDGSYENPTAGGEYRSRFGAEQTDVRLGVGARLDLGGVTVTPQAAAFTGAVEREGHTAEGGVFRASMPGLTQRYSGVKAGLGMVSDWQQGPAGLKLRPSLNLSAMQVRAESPEYELRQSDRLGIVSTTSRAHLPDASGTVLGMGAGLEAASVGGVRMRFGYAAGVMDGEVVHAVGFGLKTQF